MNGLGRRILSVVVLANLIEQAGFGLIRYSEIKAEGRRQKTEDRISDLKTKNVILGDTMGDLRKFYSLATIVLVGRSLTPMGGSDMMEPAALGKCTVFGPHTFNFKQTVEDLLRNKGAIEVKDGQELFEITRKCLSEPDYAAEIAKNGQAIIRKNQGATARSVSQIMKFLTAGD